jgi:hypothetical protein
MDERKYAKYVATEPLKKNRKGGESLTSHLLQSEPGVIVGMHIFREPFIMHEETHKHDFEQVLCFINADPTNMREFDAEIEFSLGEEREKYTITKTTMVHIPAGVYHCPVVFKRIGKPIIFLEIMLTPKYDKAVSEKYPKDTHQYIPDTTKPA